ncbi:MAG: gliding motility-associated C-terminal domain-containing protein [Flavobacteriales bacterium]
MLRNIIKITENNKAILIAVFILFNMVLAKTSFGQAPANEPVIEIPNVFSPNGDGINDVFKVSTTNVIDIQAYIYDRWGNIVYYFWGVNGFWDGRTWPAGEVCSTGVYYYIIKALSDDGDEERVFTGALLLKR